MRAAQVKIKSILKKAYLGVLRSIKPKLKTRSSVDRILKSSYLENPEFDKYIAERSIFLFASIAQPLDAMYSEAYQIDSPENILPRIILSFLGTILFSLSFVNTWVKQKIQLLAQVFCYLFLAQIAYLNVVYGFSYDYALLYTGALIVFSIYFRKTPELIAYLLIGYLMAIVASFVAESHLIGKEVFIGRLVLAAIAAFAMSKMNNVLQQRLRRTNHALVNTIKDIETLSAVATFTDNAVLVLDSNLDIEWFNTEFEKWSKLSKKDLVGRSVLSLFDKNSEDYKDFKKQFKKKKSFTKEYKRELKEGDENWYSIRVTPVLDKNGHVQRYIWVALDITDRVKAEKELVKTTEVAQEGARLKQEFLANMSHEIRTPMNAIVGFSQLLTKTELNDEQEDYLNSIKTAGNNLLVIINDILDFSKIEAGKMQIEKTSFDLAKLLHNLKSMFTPSASEKDLDFKVEMDDSMPIFYFGDPVRLNQILTNLLGNALKFTLKGGVTVKVTPLKKGKKPLVEFRVTDTGIGISEDKQDNVFKSFTQAEGETTRKFGGTGLGLSIVRSLTELMDGDIRLESKLGEGSSFIVTLPLEVDDDADRRAAEKAKENAPLEKVSGIHVLLAEDNRANQFLGKKMLGDLGYKVSIANHGKEACEMHAENDFDIILMDIQMPEMDGVEATEHIRKMDEMKKSIPIIALTAHALVEEKNRYLQSGMSDYETKPFNIKDLHSKILKWVQQYRAETLT